MDLGSRSIPLNLACAFVLALAWAGCSDSDNGMDGAGGAAGAGGAGGAGGMGGAPLVELVRFRVSDLVGDETADLSSATSPELFALDSRVASAEITYVNEATMNKGNDGPATYLPALTPDLMSGDAPGYIELTVAPARAESINPERVTYTTSAKFSSNPSSLQLRSSEDGFTAVLATIQLDQERTGTTGVTISAGDAPFSFRWVAGNDFGENGGGAAGFTTGDIVLEGAPP